LNCEDLAYVFILVARPPPLVEEPAVEEMVNEVVIISESRFSNIKDASGSPSRSAQRRDTKPHVASVAPGSPRSSYEGTGWGNCTLVTFRRRVT